MISNDFDAVDGEKIGKVMRAIGGIGIIEKALYIQSHSIYRKNTVHIQFIYSSYTDPEGAPKPYKTL